MGGEYLSRQRSGAASPFPSRLLDQQFSANRIVRDSVKSRSSPGHVAVTSRTAVLFLADLLLEVILYFLDGSYGGI
jgi:hypothetical protein